MMAEQDKLKSGASSADPSLNKGLTERGETWIAKIYRWVCHTIFFIILLIMLFWNAYLFSGRIVGMGTFTLVFFEIIVLIFIADMLDIEKVEILLFRVLESLKRK